MKNRELFHKTFDAVPVPEGLAERAAERALPERRASRRPLRTLAFAALIVALLSACALAVQKITSKPDLVTQCNIELDALQELGLFTAEFEVTMDDYVPDYEYEGYDYPRPELPEDRYEGVISLRGGGGEYSYDLDVDTGTGKITRLNITARPQENWIPKSTAFNGDPVNKIMGFYDNHEAIFDPGLTLGQLCSGWAAYQGYERYELPMDAADEVSFIGAQDLEAWNNGYSEPHGIIVSFYREGGKKPEYYSFNYAPTASGPVFMISPAEGPYVPEGRTPATRNFVPDVPGGRDAAELINAELDKLRELGLLRSELRVTREECSEERSGITGGRIWPDYTGKVYLSSTIKRSDCNYYLCYDVGTGRLDCAAVCPKPADGSLSVADVYDAGFGAVMDTELTIGEYCRLWAEYQGYESWELPEGAAEDTRVFDAHTLPAWAGGIEVPMKGGDREIDGLTLSFYRAAGEAAEYAYVKYGPSGIGPCVVIGSGYVWSYYFMFE